MYLGSHFAGRFVKKGVCRSAHNGPICKFFNFISHKIQIQRGPFYAKKCQLLYFGPHIVGRFGHIGGSANRPTNDRF